MSSRVGCRSFLSLSLLFLFEFAGGHAQTAGWPTPIALNSNSFFVDYPAMALGRDGNVFVVWECQNQGVGQSKAQLFYTHFDGHLWSTPTAITDTGKWDWTPDIAIDTSGRPHVVWGEYGSGEILHTYFDGSKWSTPENVSQDSGASYFPQIVIDHENRIHVVWHDNTPGDYSVYYRSYEGSRWSAISNVSDTLHPSGFPHLALDSKDGVHIAFQCPTAPTNLNDIFYRKCNAGVWSPIAQITSDSLESITPDIAIFHDDLPFIVWSQDLNPRPLQLIDASAFDGTEWTLPTSVEDTSESSLPSIAIDKWDNIHLVWELWYRQASHQRILYSSRINGQWSVPIDLVGPSGPTIAGRPIIKSDAMGNLRSIWIGSDNIVYYTMHSPVTSILGESHSSSTRIALMQNYPNPFNGSTQIRFSIDKQGFVSLKVFDILGRETRILKSASLEPADYSVTFDGSNLATGVYIVQLRTDNHRVFRRMLLIR